MRSELQAGRWQGGASESSGDEDLGPEEVTALPRGKRPREPEDGVTSSEDEKDSEQESDSESGGQDEGEGLSMGERRAALADGSTGRAAMLARARAAGRGSGPGKRAGRHQPAEMSSKRPVPVLRQSIDVITAKPRDPRFESLSGGTYNDDRFKRQYSFLYDEKLPEEKRSLREALKHAKSAGRRAELQAQLTRVEQGIRDEERRRWKADFKTKIKEKEKTAVKAGKGLYHLKKSETRRLELVAKYEELKASGRLDKYMEKRRKKNASKEHRHLVARRPEAGA